MDWPCARMAESELVKEIYAHQMTVKELLAKTKTKVRGTNREGRHENPANKELESNCQIQGKMAPFS